MDVKRRSIKDCINQKLNNKKITYVGDPLLSDQQQKLYAKIHKLHG